MKSWLALFPLLVMVVAISCGAPRSSKEHASSAERTETVSQALSGASPLPNVSLAAGGGDTCSLMVGGGVECWGANNQGELGIGSIGNPSPVPVAVTGLSGVAAVSGSSSLECALLSNGSVKCWGYDPYGANAMTATPTTVSGLSGVVSISASG